MRPGSNIYHYLYFQFWWPVVKRLFPLVAKVSLGQLPIKHENKLSKKQNHTHCLNECVQTLAPICNLRTPLLVISVNLHVFTGPPEISEANFWRQEIQDMPAVWQEKIAWLCHTDVAQPFIDKLVQSVLSPHPPASSSKIRWDVTNPTIQVILGCRKFPWLNINKGPMCETCVTF